MSGPATATSPVLLAYIPVLHEGYRRLIEKHPEAETVYVLGRAVTDQYRPLVKDVRAVDPQLISQALQEWFPERQIGVANRQELEHLADKKTPLIVPEEDISTQLVSDNFAENEVIFDTIFLRWDKKRAEKERPVAADSTVTTDQLTQRFAQQEQRLQQVQTEAAKSGDWWRQVGAVLVAQNAAGEETVLAGHNRHVPSEQQSYLDGDPRANYSSGEQIELSTALHAEAGLIAEAARHGLSLEGAALYVTTFPCPPCAKLVAYSGIAKLYFVEGYSLVDGASILQERDVEIVRVENDA